MKIIRLEAENLKRIKCVEITPDGSVVVVSGRNAQGKTSVLDSIWLALGGGKAARATDRPIRDGEKRASVTLDLGELRVTRSWTAKGTKLLVEAADGSKVKGPQKLLDSLIGSLSFDPLAFAGLPAKDQVATLLQLVELPFDPAEIEEERRQLFDDRTAANRNVKNLEASLGTMPKPVEGLPSVLVSLIDLLDELKAAQAAHEAFGQARRKVDACELTVSNTTTDLEQAEATVELLRSGLDSAKQRLAEAKEFVATWEELPDVSAIETRLAEVEVTNDAIRAGAKHADAAAHLARARDRANLLSDDLEAIDERKAAGLREASMPVMGLGFDEGGVTFAGIPFGQCSSAERLRVSMAMAMAMALNPKIRVIRITDASLLDSVNMALVKQMATDNDFQVWLEVVREDGAVGVVIEDGEVVAVDGKSCKG